MVILIGIVAIELVIYSPPIRSAENTLAISVQSDQSVLESTKVRLTITHGSSDQDVRFVAFPLITPPRDRSVFIFNDASFPIAGISGAVVQGIFDHVYAELKVHRYASPVVGVTADGLRDVLKAVDLANQRTVVMMTGVLPATIFSKEADLLSPWVKAGGLAVWGGGAIGYWTGVGGRPLSVGDSLGEAGTKRLLGPDVVRFPTVFGRTGGLQGDAGSALGVSYRYTGVGVLRSSVESQGGLTLGWYSGPYSSLSYLPVGLGGYLIFGGEILDETSVSLDVARILLDGVTYGTGPIVGMESHLTNVPRTSSLVWNLPFASAAAGIMFVAFDPAPDGTFYFKHTIQ